MSFKTAKFKKMLQKNSSLRCLSCNFKKRFFFIELFKSCEIGLSFLPYSSPSMQKLKYGNAELYRLLVVVNTLLFSFYFCQEKYLKTLCLFCSITLSK